MESGMCSFAMLPLTVRCVRVCLHPKTHLVSQAEKHGEHFSIFFGFFFLW